MSDTLNYFGCCKMISSSRNLESSINDFSPKFWRNYFVQAIKKNLHFQWNGIFEKTLTELPGPTHQKDFALEVAKILLQGLKKKSYQGNLGKKSQVKYSLKADEILQNDLLETSSLLIVESLFTGEIKIPFLSRDITTKIVSYSEIIPSFEYESFKNDRLSYYENNTIIENFPIDVSLKVEPKRGTNSNTGKCQNSENFQLCQKSVGLYKEATQAIEKHLINPKNPFCIIKKVYLKYFTNLYKFLQDDRLEKGEVEKGVQRMLQDLKEFILIVQNAIILFYSLNIYSANYEVLYDLFCKENMYYFLLNNFFSSLDNFVIFIYRRIYKENEILLKEKMKNHKIELNPQFSLCNRTLQLYSIDKIDLKEAYSEVISLLKRIKLLSSPIHKFKILFLAIHKIFDEIEGFYCNNGISKRNEITSDDFLQIVIYLLWKCQQYTLYSDVRFIAEFLSPLTLNSCKGYYLITSQAALDFIISQEDIKSTKNEN